MAHFRECDSKFCAEAVGTMLQPSRGYFWKEWKLLQELLCDTRDSKDDILGRKKANTSTITYDSSVPRIGSLAPITSGEMSGKDRSKAAGPLVRSTIQRCIRLFGSLGQIYTPTGYPLMRLEQRTPRLNPSKQGSMTRTET